MMSFFLLAAAGKSKPTPVKTVMLLHADGVNGAATFSDAATGLSFTGISGDALASNSKFGSTAMGMVSGGSWSGSVPTSRMAFGLNSFTLEFFINVTTVNANVGGAGTYYIWPIFLWGSLYSGTSAINIGLTYIENTSPFSTGGGFELTYQNAGVTVNFPLTSNATLARATWYHIALVSVNGVMTLYVNGVATGATQNLSSPGITQTYASTTALIGTAQGASGAATWSASGYIDEFRLSNVARYTSNFTPPTSAFILD